PYSERVSGRAGRRAEARCVRARTGAGRAVRAPPAARRREAKGRSRPGACRRPAEQLRKPQVAQINKERAAIAKTAGPDDRVRPGSVRWHAEDRERSDGLALEASAACDHPCGTEIDDLGLSFFLSPLSSFLSLWSFVS